MPRNNSYTVTVTTSAAPAPNPPSQYPDFPSLTEVPAVHGIQDFGERTEDVPVGSYSIRGNSRHYCHFCGNYFAVAGIRFRRSSGSYDRYHICHQCANLGRRFCPGIGNREGRCGANLYRYDDECAQCNPPTWSPKGHVNDMVHSRVGGVSLTYGLELEIASISKNYRELKELTAFGAKSDGSIRYDGDGGRGLQEGLEFVSPPMQGNKGITELQKFLNFANQHHWRVNASCGLHMHIGVGQLDWKEMQSVLAMYYLTEGRYWRSFVEDERMENDYCQPLNPYWLDCLRSASSWSDFIESDATREMDAGCDCGDPDCEEGHGLGCQTRYFWMNTLAWEEHNTIENRLHHGTTNFPTIRDWVQCNLKLVATSVRTPMEELVKQWNDNFTTKDKDGWMRACLGQPLLKRMVRRARQYGHTLTLQ